MMLKRDKSPIFLRKSGFTILEVLVGVSIFAIGLLGITTMHISSIKSIKFSSDLTEATYLATNKVEILKGYDYDHPLLSDRDGDGTGKDLDDDNVDDTGNNFGLDDMCMATVDANCTGDAQADWCEGCTAAEGFGTGRNNIFRIYHNIAEDEEMDDCKVINVIVTWASKKTSRHIVVRAERCRPD
jgi:prepilin-type N-terminal cleavage/methylation domain-containing protein